MEVSIPNGIDNSAINTIPCHSSSGSDGGQQIPAGSVVVSIHGISASPARECSRIAETAVEVSAAIARL